MVQVVTPDGLHGTVSGNAVTGGALQPVDDYAVLRCVIATLRKAVIIPLHYLKSMGLDRCAFVVDNPLPLTIAPSADGAVAVPLKGWWLETGSPGAARW